MLQLRPGCEACDLKLPGDSLEARICSFECTFCAPCALRLGACPNCGGELLPRPRRVGDALSRPRRVGDALSRHPASTERVFKPR